MDKLMLGLNNFIIKTYLDDILVFITCLQDHNARLKSIFVEAQLKIQVNNPEFQQKSVSYLGHVIL